MSYLGKINQATGYASQHIWCLCQARVNWEGCARKGTRHKNGGDCRGGLLISLDGVAGHLDCWCICLYYLHFAPENPEDVQTGGGETQPEHSTTLFEPRMCVWKTHEEYQSMVTAWSLPEIKAWLIDKVMKAEWIYLDVMNSGYRLKI